MPQPGGAAQPGATPQPGMGGGVLSPTSDLSLAIRQGVQGPQLLDYMPIPLRNEINQIISGNAAPPSLSARNPQARQLMMIAAAVDPTFDATQYGARYATNRSFSAGPDAQSVKAINQTMYHAAHLLDNINQLNNYSGMMPGAGELVQEYVRGACQRSSHPAELRADGRRACLRDAQGLCGAGRRQPLRVEELGRELPAQCLALPATRLSSEWYGAAARRDSGPPDRSTREAWGRMRTSRSSLDPRAQQAISLITNMDPRTGNVGGQGAAPQAGGQQGAGQAMERGVSKSGRPMHRGPSGQWEYD